MDNVESTTPPPLTITTMPLTNEYQQLLRDLKSIVESLLISGVTNVWNVYGGLNRLHTAIENIFKHQCKAHKSDGNIDCWSFIQGLSWLQPDITNSTLSVDSEYQPHLPTHLKTDKVSLWLYRSLESHSLSQKLSWLLSDKEHLLSCYNSNAFLCQEKYAEATLICLRAVERSEPSLMSDIDPCLFLNKYGASAKDFHKIHRRCSSFPDATNFHTIPAAVKKITFKQSVDICDSSQRKCKKILENRIIPAWGSKKFYGKLKPWRSLPNLQLENIKIRRRSATVVKHSATTPSSPIKPDDKLSPSILKIDYTSYTIPHCKKRKLETRKHTKKEHNNTSSSCNSKKIEVENMSTKSLPCTHYKSEKLNLAIDLVRSAPDYTFSVLPGEKDYSKRPQKSFIEDGGNSVLPMSTGFFPRPSKGQSLTSFLSSGQFSHANAELDRENAHFSISEAMIAVIEQIKWKRELKLEEEQVDDSDEEINHLKQRIRLRRRQKQLEKQRKLWSVSLLSDGRTDTTTTEASASPFSTSPDSDSETLSTDGVDDLEIDEASNLTEQKGLSMSMASLYSEGDLLKKPRGAPDGQSDILSAEGVALSLISRFNEKQLPRASELEWLVSKQEAPQDLLPMPKSWPVNPEEYTPLRGTTEWAPPRPQIIFTIHPTPVRKILIAKQDYRCAGCGMKVAPQYASRFRYCNYLGRYFCTGCHTNQLALIPGRILQKWDFSRYSVSSFSYRLLEQMYNDPLFRVMELNPILLRKSRNLEKTIKYRLQLFYLKDFILSCRFAEMEQESIRKESPYVLVDSEIYSLNDLVQIKAGDILNRLKSLIDICCKHVFDCQLCSARGFICEICNRIETIYPWQLDKVSRCDKCGNCFHTSCRNTANKSKSCSKCKRIEARQANKS